jgi:NodT family efflux transporter outer membrane factor (OMF) lipoprotein
MHRFKTNKLLFIIVSLLMMSACKVTEQYTIADMNLPQEYRLPDSVSESLESGLPDSVSRKLDDAIVPWKDFFQDSLLVELINHAFEQNFDLRIANKEIAINNQYYKQSKAAFWPKLNLNLLNIERDWSSKNSSSSPASDWYDAKDRTPPENMFVSSSEFSSTAALGWELDIWGKLRNKKRAARALYRQSYQARKAIQTEVVASVAEDYYTLLMLDAQIKVANANYNYRDSTLSMIRLQYQSGEVTSLAIQQSHSQVLEAKALILKLERERATKENNLRLLTGRLPHHIKRDMTLSALDTTYQTAREMPLYLVQNRPDVRVARYGLKSANARVGVTQAARYPNLTISLSGGVSSVLGKNWFNVPGSLLGSIIGGLTAPIFNGRKLKTDFEVARLERDEAEINFQRTVYGAVVDIKNALISIDKLKKQLKIAKKKVNVSQKGLKNSRMLFRSGYATYLEVITAQSEVLNDALNLVKTKASLLTARIQLYRALGGGWKK